MKTGSRHMKKDDVYKTRHLHNFKGTCVHEKGKSINKKRHGYEKTHVNM